MRSHSRQLFLPIALIILSAAAFLRLYDLAQYPPGPHYDEAVNLIVSRSIAFGGAHYFPILEAYQGREVLYFYLNAPFLTLIHDGMFTIHLTNAFLNLITIAASMALGRTMFRGWRGVVIGLGIGVMMTISFPQIWLGRQAYRAVTLPFCQSFALLLLWRGINRKRGYGWLVAGGFFAGLALYTYMASRLFPLWLALGGLVLLVMDRHNWQVRLRQGVVFFGVMLLVAAPMIAYAIQRPDIFFNRLSEVGAGALGGEPVTLAESILLHLRMFFIEGDPYFRYNIAGRPYLTLPEGLLLLIGIGVAFVRLVRKTPATEKVAYTLALLSPLMVIPSVISIGGLPPSHMRSLGMVPLIFVLVAVGAEYTLQIFARNKRAVLIVVITSLTLGGANAAREYFAWASSAALFYETDADLAAAGKWVAANRQPNEIVYVAARDRGHPTFAIANISDVTWLGTDSLVLPPSNRTGLYIFPRSARPSELWLQYLEGGRISDIPNAPDERPAFEAFRFPYTSILTEAPGDSAGRNPYLIHLGTYLKEFFASQTAQVARSGEPIQLISVWRVEQPPPMNDLTLIVQLEDENRFVIARGEPYMTETDRWRVGETLFQQVALNIPIGTPPGDYLLRLAWVARSTEQYVNYSNGIRGEGGIWLNYGSLRIEKPDSFADPSALNVDARVDQDVAEGVRLLGWNNFPNELRPGELLPLITHWYAAITDQTRENVPLQIRLGYLVLEESAFNELPPETWLNGEIVTLRGRYEIPRDHAAGAYPLTLTLNNSQIILGDVTINGVPRLFDVPPIERVVDYRVGDSFVLVGYTLTMGDDGTRLELVWHSLEEVDADYTVFVHLLDENGEIIEQADVMPMQNSYPTSLWAAGEYIVDRYAFEEDTPFAINVGMYVQETGVRLQIENEATAVFGDDIQVYPYEVG
jgi:4-amino-4-deoxy-L-arabinose transferase-like glycosyltransferase